MVNVCGLSGLPKTHFLQGCTRVAPLHIGHDVDLEVRHTIERHLIIFDLVHGAWRAKGILLPHDLPVGLAAVGGPPHDELLGARLLGFGEDEPQLMQRLGAIKDEPDNLRARLGGPPPRRGVRQRRRWGAALCVCASASPFLGASPSDARGRLCHVVPQESILHKAKGHTASECCRVCGITDLC
jgi:hypothetical protein